MPRHADTEMGGPGRDFLSTHWGDLLALKDKGHPEFASRLNQLVERYWKPAYYYIRTTRNVSVEDAKDLTQQFFTMLLSRASLERLSPDRGSFRGFLKTALRYFLVSADRARSAREPRNGAKLFQFDEVEREWLESVPTRLVSPEEAFDRKWAREVLMDAVRRLEQELKNEGKELYFSLFHDYCMTPAPPSYGELSDRYRVSQDDIKNHLRYARQRIRGLLKLLLFEYVSVDNIEDELYFVLES